MDERRALEHYLELPYTIQFQRDAEHWFAQVVELPGCMTEGDTLAEAAEMIVDAMKGWLEIALEDGLPIPEPRPVDGYSGKFVVRVPRSLHRDLVQMAEREGISLNQYVNVLLSRAVGQPASDSVASWRVPATEEPTLLRVVDGEEKYKKGQNDDVLPQRHRGHRE